MPMIERYSEGVGVAVGEVQHVHYDVGI
ncbi:hypothetical protein PROAA_290018 [Candidatus Propionivibrio aalborgensis]|uniref:Uncharacterized protein n=1 Tax=Candidatus Propionivibrio aalborgensis TaxID=1860101 RepID=A0A1A8XUH2_9RHOO|nr:hypothetical protein PROAA_290018 [Candidatus Propionivibrio aalborgensis]